MAIRMPDLFQWSRKWLLFVVTVFLLCLVVAQSSIDRYFEWYSLVTTLAQILLLVTPPLALLTAGAWLTKRYSTLTAAVKIFRWSRWELILSSSLLALCAIVAQLSMLQSYDLYLAVTLIAQLTLYAAAPLALLVLVSGLITAFKGRKKSSAAEDNTLMNKIKGRLSPDEKDYLQQRLDEQLVALGEDGELLSVDDMLGEQEVDEQQS